MPPEPDKTETFDVQAALAAEIRDAGGPVTADPADAGSIGRTMFDLPGSSDMSITVLLPKQHLHRAPSQSLLRIESRSDGRRYLGVVSAGPFAEPDGLRGDSPLLVAVSTHDGAYLPPFHGRVQVTLLGEQLRDGTLSPPRFRPIPNSPVFTLDDAESAEVMKCDGDIRLGLAVGHDTVEVCVPSGSKSVFPRHTAILGTTGGGKSNTVAGLVQRTTDAGMAVILLDVEGEYTQLHQPAEQKKLLTLLGERKLKPQGIDPAKMTVYHLVGRGTSNPSHPDLRPFSLQFSRLSPYAIFEILDLPDAQQERFLKAYDIAKEVMRELGIYPRREHPEDERFLLEMDEFDRGYPRITLPILLDVVGACIHRADGATGAAKAKKAKGDEEESDYPLPRSHALNTAAGIASLKSKVNAANPPGNVISWRGLIGRLGRLNRLKVFYDEANGPRPLSYAHLLQPGRLSVVDLSDTGFSELNNLVIADLLRGVQEAQEERYEAHEKDANKPLPRVLIVIEEAHEFLSEERISRMPILFQQLSRIAKRGRKRWLGLAFVTQLPAHLPKSVLGLCNSFVLHKLNDPQVVTMLKRTVGGVDEGLWDRLPSLAPGQAVAAFPHMTRPMLVSIDPAAARLRMTE